MKGSAGIIEEDLQVRAGHEEPEIEAAEGMGARTRRHGRWRWLPPALVLVVALGVLLEASATLLRTPPQTVSRAPVAPPYATTVPCRPQTFVHVHHPNRLALVARCATVTGTVRSTKWQSSDGDWRVELLLDPAYAGYVLDRHQPFVIKVLPPDVATVRLPSAGERVAASGAWVRNRNHGNTVQLHPTWAIQRLDADGVPRQESSLPPVPALDIHVDAPARAAVGDAFVLTATVTTGGVAHVPVPRAHLWLEIVPATGSAVQWKAGLTNALGVTAIPVVALYRPGTYRLHLYVESGRRVTPAVRLLEVVR